MSDPDVKRILRGGRALRLLGVLLLVPGVQVPLTLLVGREAAPLDGDARAGLGFSAGSAVVGLVLLIGRRGVLLDRRSQTATTWWGPLVPLGRKEHPLVPGSVVSIEREVRATKHGAFEVFPVGLEGGATRLSLGERRAYVEARRLAEESAEHLGLTLVDRSCRQATRRGAGTLDEPLRARALREGRVTALPRPPERAVCSVRKGSDGARVVEIPAPGVRSTRWAAVAVATVFAAFGLSSIGYAPLWYSLFGVVPLGITLFPILDAALAKRRVTLSRSGVIVERRWLLGTRRIELPAAEIEEVGRANGVVIRSDRASVELGAHLRNPEQTWLRKLIVHVLTARAEG